MKVGVITSTYPRHEGDYAVPWMREQVKRLKDEGLEVCVFAPSYQGLEDHELDGVPVRRFRYFPSKWERLTHEEGAPNKLRNPLFNLLAIPYVACGVLAAKRWAAQERPDVIHVHWPFPHGAFAEAARRSIDAPVVSTCHGAELTIADKKPWARKILARYLNRSDALTTNSSDTGARVSRLTGATPAVIPYGATVEGRPAARERDGTPVILFTGRLIQRKGVEYLIDAIPKILRSRDVRVVITGDGDQRENIEERIRAHSLSSVVEMRGFVDKDTLSELYSTSDVYVLPAVYDDEGDTEGLGVTSIEAFHYGLPVVASGIGGIVDVVKHRETGLLVEEKDSEAIADAVLELLGDPELCSALASAGLERVQTYFDWSRITRETIEVYERAINSRSSCAKHLGEVVTQ